MDTPKDESYDIIIATKWSVGNEQKSQQRGKAYIY